MTKFKQLLLAFLIVTAANAQEKEPKTGWNLGPLPAVGYNSDLGYQFGALCSFFYYGDGSVFPEYLHKFHVEASLYSKGSGMYHFFYDSKYLIRNSRLTFAATYLPNKMMSFYGFNGYASPYDDKHAEGSAFYSMDRKMLRILADYQKGFATNLKWAAGLAFWNYKLDRVQLDTYKNDTTLFEIYQTAGIISPKEASGGSHAEIKIGLIYDSRDHEAAPAKGIWAETILYGSPDIFQKNNNSYLKLSAHFRHYVPLMSDKLVFAYHLAYQGTIAGNVPFYVQQNVTTLYLRQINSEGLGGINTIRGVLYNRIVGDGLCWSNFEIRWKLFNFRFLKQNWYFGVNPFFDAGKIVQSYKLEEMKAANTKEIFSEKSEDFDKMHFSAGLGAKIVMNRNFVISAEFGKPFDKRDGTSGLNIGLNYIF
ncbi:MAG: hypothetical protein FWH18_06030 [Marinilabiliaceae bacterium]|nr:hypothetical protein [Marinilabiliaceae bacterium]